MLKLSKEQQDKLRNKEGPYSEVNIKIEDRLLDNYSSRQFVTVYANINPLTFEIATQNLHSFDSDIQGLLMSCNFQGMDHGYVVCNYSEQVSYEDINSIHDVLLRAQKAKQVLTHHVIQLHYFVMDLLNIKYKSVTLK